MKRLIAVRILQWTAFAVLCLAVALAAFLGSLFEVPWQDPHPIDLPTPVEATP